MHPYFSLKNLGQKSAHYTWQHMVFKCLVPQLRCQILTIFKVLMTVKNSELGCWLLPYFSRVKTPKLGRETLTLFPPLRTMGK